MKNISLVRIDDRLIHGQVMTQWMRFCNFNTIVIVDDAIAKDAFLSQVATMAVPREFTGLVYNIDDAANYLLGDAKNERILVLVKYVEVIEKLVKKGVKIPELNVGGIGLRPGRESVYRNFALSKDEKETFKRLIEDGMNVYVQMVPSDSRVNIEKLI